MSDGVSISTSSLFNTVDSSKWDEMNFNELLNQKTILLDRYEYMVRMGNRRLADTMLEGVGVLDSLIAQKSLK